MHRFSNKTILVTGASSGIGRSCAIRLAEEGANLILVGRREETLRSLVPDSNPHVLVSDLAKEVEVQRLVGRLKEEGTAITGWLLAAGVHALRPLLLESPESLHDMWATNVFSSLYLLALAQKSRLIAPESSVVLFSSAAATASGGGQVSYAASKGAVEAIARSLALEWSSQKIRVNAIVPGVVRTPMSDKTFKKLSAEQIANLESRHPLGFGRPEDIAGPALFLLSDDSRWMTGATMVVDGGFCIG